MTTTIIKKIYDQKKNPSYKNLADIYIKSRKNISSEDVYQNMAKNKAIYKKFVITIWKQPK